MACAERSVQSRRVQAERLLGGSPDACDAHNEQTVVGEDEMLRPGVVSGVEEAIGSACDPMRDLLPFRRIAEGTAPGEVAQVVRSASIRRWHHGTQPTRGVPVPERRRDDVVNVDLASRWKQAVLAPIPRP